ncbi:MAG: hypothetical protein H6721_29865 [Sandaracinus sp.]|nr:hypothetical protein [Sandaracinus sp.]MCB9636338.1 hypothetical protein [Sandaracinus sp.]
MRASIAFALVLVACGGGSTGTTSPSTVRFDPETYFLEIAATRTDLVVAPQRSIEDLEEAKNAARGNERRTLLIELARAHMAAAGTSSNRDERRHRDAAERFAKASAQGSRDAEVKARAAFVELWLAFRASHRSAMGRATRFSRQHAQSGELALLAWVIRGELAFAAEQWEDARTSYRYVLGDLEHPLYAYALWRTARSHAGAGDAESARSTTTEVVRLACQETSEPTRRVAFAAARELAIGLRDDSDGVTRPEICDPPVETHENGEAGWRPPE